MADAAIHRWAFLDHDAPLEVPAAVRRPREGIAPPRVHRDAAESPPRGCRDAAALQRDRAPVGRRDLAVEVNDVTDSDGQVIGDGILMGDAALEAMSAQVGGDDTPSMRPRLR